MEELFSLGEGPLKEDSLVEEPVAGFEAAALAAGIRSDGREDLALIAAREPVAAAGVFTRNRLVAAPVVVSRRHLATGRVQAVLINSGCANAATGQAGMEACLDTCRQAAQALDCRPEEVLPCSTGVIGQLLPAEKITARLPELVERLAPEGLPQAAQAIRTTDAFVKMSRAECELSGRPVRVVGLAKGAGMIRPDMATMLAFVLTDAAVAPAALDQVLRAAVEQSLNRITVDGDTSTNDTTLLLASGRAGNPPLEPGHPELGPLTEAVTAVCRHLGAMIVADGEGAEHLVRVVISGAPDQDTARALCYAIAHSPLCKTAFAGCDPNWGRLLSTTGAEAARRGAAFDPDKTRLWIGEALIAQGAAWCGPEAEKLAAEVMRRPRYQVRLDLGLGGAYFWVLTSDLGHEYVTINADYRT